MTIEIKKNNLLKALNHISGAVEKRNSVPILTNVKISATDSNFVLTATDMELSVTESIHANIEQDINTTIPATLFYEIVKKLPDAQDVKLQHNPDKQIFTISCSKSKFNLPTISSQDYPDIQISNIEKSFKLSKNDLQKMIDKTKFAISTEETRYYLNGLFLHDTKSNDLNILRAVATDGHRLARVDFPLPDGAENMPDIIIPRKTIYEIRKIIADDNETDEVLFEISKTKIKISFKNSHIISKLIDGTYPNYQRVIPDKNNIILKTKLKNLADAIDRVSTINIDRSKAIRFQVKSNKILLTAKNDETGDAMEEISVDFNNESIETGFNSKYLLEMTSIIDGEEAEFRFENNVSPATIHDSKDDSSLFVIMPMKV
jgi:DNA polymerase III subunit beta